MDCINQIKFNKWHDLHKKNMLKFLLLYLHYMLICFNCDAGCYVDWYFTRDKTIRLPGRTLIAAVWRTLRYHTGSVAFGSLIIAIVQTARAILDYIDEQFSGSRSDIAQFIMKCCKCCLWCLEKVCFPLLRSWRGKI